MEISTSKFFKDNKIARDRWPGAICSLKNLKVLIYTKLYVQEIMLLLTYHLNEKSITIVKTEFLQHVTLFVISTLYTFALMLHEKWTRFQRHFFVCVIKPFTEVHNFHCFNHLLAGWWIRQYTLITSRNQKVQNSLWHQSIISKPSDPKDWPKRNFTIPIHSQIKM